MYLCFKIHYLLLKLSVYIIHYHIWFIYERHHASCIMHHKLSVLLYSKGFHSLVSYRIANHLWNSNRTQLSNHKNNNINNNNKNKNNTDLIFLIISFNINTVWAFISSIYYILYDFLFRSIRFVFSVVDIVYFGCRYSPCMLHRSQLPPFKVLLPYRTIPYYTLHYIIAIHYNILYTIY